MLIKLKPSAVTETTVKEYALRFLLGGLATAAAGLIAERFGPVTGGLFLALPAIFPASATIVESHQRARKRRLGLNGDKRARQAVIAEAKGTEIGCLGLAAFAAVAWKTLPSWPAPAAIAAAGLAWIVVSAGAWWTVRRLG